MFLGIKIGIPQTSQGAFGVPQGGIDAFTKLMLHMDGTNGSTNFIDSELTPKTITTVADAQISTAQFKFGGASGLFDGTLDEVTAPDSGDWNFAAGDFTIDFWARWQTLPTSGNYNAFFSQFVDNSNRHFAVVLNSAGTFSLEWGVIAGGVTVIDTTITLTISTNTWYHFAFVRTNNTARVFQTGLQVGTDGTFVGSVPDLAAAFSVAGYSAGAIGHFNGWFDEFRVSKGIARWTSAFTPPASAYTL